tara:strand:+ start:37 stop:207 length:171 start_codon:yes stop_codon:yes gene_type:complete
MRIIIYGKLNTEKPTTYSNGSGRGFAWLNDKQFARAEKKFQKYMQRQQKKLNKNKS